MAATKKTMLFAYLLVAALAAVLPATQGTFILPPLLTTTQVQGVVFCTVNGTATVGANGVVTSSPFPFALVQLRCGSGTGIVVSNSITGFDGQFTISVSSLTFSTAQIVAGCRVVVTTPLARCNTTLSSNGTLTSNLTQTRTVNLGLIRINFVSPTGFQASP